MELSPKKPTNDIVTVICAKCKAEILCNMTYCPYCGKKQHRAANKHLKRANGTGSVYKKDGNRSKPWAAVKDGHYLGHYATRKEAQEALEHTAGRKISDAYNYTFAQVYAAWKPAHFADITPSAQRQYEDDYLIFADLYNRKFRDLRADDFQAILDQHKSKSVNTVAKYKQLITQMSEWARKNDIIATNYASFCSVRGREAKHHEPLTDAEIRLIEQDGSETAGVVVMLLSTGMRIGELFALRLEDYHDTYVVGGEKSDAGRDRIIPIRPEGRTAFAHFAAKAREAGGSRIIDGYSGNREIANFRARDYKPMLKRLGIDTDKTPHSTRTTYGTRAATEDELSPAVLQKVMGHSKFDTTQKYYNRPDAAQLVKAVEDSATR